MGTLVNATTTTTEVVLNLESDDNPSITSILASPTTFAESASSTITATLDLPSSRDVIVPITFNGTAISGIDYTETFASKGEESLLETFLNNGSTRYVQLLDGRYVLANGSSLIIYNPIPIIYNLILIIYILILIIKNLILIIYKFDSE